MVSFIMTGYKEKGKRLSHQQPQAVPKVVVSGVEYGFLPIGSSGR
jgi:hypothetical protein